MAEPGRIIATIDARNGYDGAIEAIRVRIAETGMNLDKIDQLSGLPEGYTGKLIADSRPKQFSLDSWLAILATLGLADDLRIDPFQEAIMRAYWEPGQENLRRPFRKATLGKGSIDRLISRIAPEMGRRGGKSIRNPSARLARNVKGGKARWRKLTKRQRTDIARKAANARWGKRNILNVGRSKRDKGA